jgi:hypothetical protein
VVRIELIIHVNVITPNDDIHLNGPQILFYLKLCLKLGSNGYENRKYIHAQHWCYWLNAPSTPLWTLGNCYLGGLRARVCSRPST